MARGVGHNFTSRNRERVQRELAGFVADPPAAEKGTPLARVVKRAKNARFEQTLAFHVRAHGLPEPIEQFRWATELLNDKGNPRQFRADFAWPAKEYRLLVEVQGGVWRVGGGAHSHPTNIIRDIEKAQCAVMLGYYVLPVTTDECKSGKAVALLERFFATRGWSR